MFIAKVLVTASAFFSLASATNYSVTVGAQGLNYDPPSVSNVVAGDYIIFQFTSSSHTATQSTFASPCTASSGGFNSGLLSSSSSPPQYAVPVNSTDPLWFFCSVPSHCKSGMVFAVNPTTSQTYEAFKANAVGGGSPSSGSSTTTSPHASSSTPASGGGGYGSSTGSGAKTSVQKLTAGLAGVAFLVKLFL